MLALALSVGAFLVPRAPPVRARTQLQMQVRDKSAVREYSNVEEKALRRVRKGFGGYPAGPYYGLPRDEAYENVRKDEADLSAWSDDEIEATVDSLNATPLEILIDTPIGPFLFLSAIAIAQDGGGNLFVGLQKLVEPR